MSEFTDYKVADMSLAEWGRKEIAMAEVEMPGLMALREEYEGQKVDILSVNPKVSFCAIGLTKILPDRFSTTYESVIATGIAEELFGDRKREGLTLLIKKYSPEHIPRGIVNIDKLFDKAKVFKISIDSITGKASR